MALRSRIGYCPPPWSACGENLPVPMTAIARWSQSLRLYSPMDCRRSNLPVHRRCPMASTRPTGVVTLLKEEHENFASRIFSNDRDCFAPHVHSRRAKGSVRPCRNEMTLDVEIVVGG